MHRLPLLAVGYIKIVTHGGLACNCVVASHTKAVSLLWAPGPIGAGQCGFHIAVNFAFTEFSEVQLRDAERRSVRRVISSSCSQPSPTKEYSSSKRKFPTERSSPCWA